jgi:Putative motility protein
MKVSLDRNLHLLTANSIKIMLRFFEDTYHFYYFLNKTKPFTFPADNKINFNCTNEENFMIDSISGAANLAITLQQQKLSQQIDIAVMNKVKDIQEQQGQSALQLLESTKITQGIDVHA